MSKQSKVDTTKYVTIVQLQETTEDNYCYVAYHPELPNAMSQGDTTKEAKENLIEATELAIAHLVENNLPIPEPMSFKASAVNDLSAHRPVPSDRVTVSNLSVRSSGIRGNSDQDEQTELSAQVEILAVFDRST